MKKVIIASALLLACIFAVGASTEKKNIDVTETVEAKETVTASANTIREESVATKNHVTAASNNTKEELEPIKPIAIVEEGDTNDGEQRYENGAVSTDASGHENDVERIEGSSEGEFAEPAAADDIPDGFLGEPQIPYDDGTDWTVEGDSGLPEGEEQTDGETDTGYSEEVVAEYEEPIAEEESIAEEPVVEEPVVEESADDGSWVYYSPSSRITHYCWCSSCNGRAYQNTASGVPPTAFYTCAAGPSIPFGTEVLINGNVYVVQDRGVADDQFDIFIGEDHQLALDMGMYYAEVWIRFPQ